MTTEHAAELRIVRPGDFVFVPPEVIHQELNLDDHSSVEMIVGRNGQENVVFNVNVEER